jgi:methyl-accepting chemotaxis protein
LNLLLAITVSVVVVSLNRDVDTFVAASESRYQSYLLADELRQSSDDLTRLGRTYTISGDDKYEKMYFDVLDIRNGIKAGPENYNQIY